MLGLFFSLNLLITPFAILWFVLPLYYDRPPTSSDTFVALTIAFAVSTGCIGADLKMIPNQPLLFTVIYKPEDYQIAIYEYYSM
jgi:hypothetical protein